MNFPYPTIEVSGESALERWRELRAVGAREGFYPLIIGDESDAEILAEAHESSDASIQEIIATGKKGDATAVLAERKENDPEIYEDVPEGDWPSVPSKHTPTAHRELSSGRPKKRVFIAKIPTTHSHEVPAFLRFGAWNDCPYPEQHVTMLKHWNEKYGAEILSLTGDTLECFVARPPTSREQARALADEQFIYCSDIVFQGVQELNTLAASLQDANYWFFWWD